MNITLMIGLMQRRIGAQAELAQVEAWAKRVLDAPSLTGVFEEPH